MKKTFKSLLSLLLTFIMLLSCMSALSAVALSNTIVSVTATAGRDLIEGLDGYMTASYIDDEYVDYFYYFVTSADLDLTVTMADGSIVEGDLDSVREQLGVDIRTTTNQSAANPWTPGNTYTVDCTMIDSDLEDWAPITQFNFTVRIVENPVASVTVLNKITLIENTEGYWSNRYNEETASREEYYYYHLPSLDFFVTMKDGTTLVSDYGEIAYNNSRYLPVIDQSHNPLKAGVNKIPFSILGYNSTLEIEVIDTPVASIEIEKFSIIENANGTWKKRYNTSTQQYENYFYYYLPEIDFTVTMKDGTTLVSDYGGIDYNNSWYSPGIDQSRNPLKAGVNKIPFSILGYNSTLEIEVIDTPVASIEIEKISVIENALGYWDTRTNETEEEEETFFIYELPKISFTVTMKDGTVLTSSNGTITYEDREYDLSIDQYNTPLRRGSNKIPFSVLGYEGSFEIEVTETPVSSITLEPICFIEKSTDTSMPGKPLITQLATTEEDTPPYYNFYNAVLVCTAELKDGTILKSSDGTITYDNTEYPVTLIDDQYANPLEPGENIVRFSCLGFEADAQINIIEDPIQEITVEPLKVALSECVKDNSSNSFSFELQERIFVQVTFKDGSSIRLNPLHLKSSKMPKETPFKYKNVNYSLEGHSGTLHVKEAGNYTLPFYFMGNEISVAVEVVDDISVPFKYDEVDGGVVITAYAGPDTEELVIPSEIDGKPVIGIIRLPNLGGAKTVRIPDSVTHIATKNLYFRGVKNLYLGSGISEFDLDMITHSLAYIEVSENNKHFCSIDGVLYSKDRTKVVAYPPAKGKVFEVPSFVSDIDIFTGSARYNSLYMNTEIVIPEDSEHFRTVDGVTYSRDMTNVLWVSANKTGHYDMPESVRTISAKAFEGCALSSVSISPNVTEIAYAVFASCPNLVSVDLPESVVSIGNQSFAGCNGLSDIDLSCVTSFESSCFSQCHSLTNITLSEDLTEAPSSLFSNCTKIEEITIPASLKNIPAGMFSGCSGLKKVTLEDGVESIGASAFSNTAIETISFPQSLQQIGSYAFSKCKALTKLDIDCGISVIPSGAFADCTSLTDLSVGANVTQIENNAFVGCTAIANLTLPDTLLSIDISLADTVYCRENATEENGLIYLNNILIKSNPSVSGKVTIKEGTKMIANFAFENKNIKEVICPDSIYAIGNSAFANCTSLVTITFPENLQTIGDRAFENCTSLAKADLPDGLQIIGQYAFYNTALRSVSIPDSVTDIVYRSFASSPIAMIDMPETAVNIGKEIFADTTWYNAQEDGLVYLDNVLYEYKGFMPTLSEITIEGDIKSIAGEAFSYKYNMTKVNIPDSVEVIGDNAFFGCMGLTQITLPASLKSVDDYAFAFCPISEITLPDGLENLGSYVFKNTKLTSITLPASVRLVNPLTFKDCTMLTEIHVAPDNPWFTSIDGVLYNKDATKLIYCPEGKTDTITLAAKVTEAEPYAFLNTRAQKIVVMNPTLKLDAETRDMSIVYGPQPPIYEKFNTFNPVTICAPLNSEAHKYALARGYIFQESAHLHYYTSRVLTEATCETAGQMIYECDCGASYTEQIASLGHIDADNNGYCDRCEGDPPVQNGDADGDGKISAADARFTLRFTVGLDPMTEEQKQAADVNKDGAITAGDARLILRASVGLETL